MGLFAVFLQAHSPSEQPIRRGPEGVRTVPTQLAAGAAFALKRGNAKATRRSRRWEWRH
jgi:hypothetical protein